MGDSGYFQETATIVEMIAEFRFWDFFDFSFDIVYKLVGEAG